MLHRSTAVVCYNDKLAINLLRFCRQHDINVPEDLSIVGCDNLFCAPYLIPALTSIDTHQQLLGQKAVELLLSGETRRENAAWTLVRRDSCAPCKSGEPAFRTAGY